MWRNDSKSRKALLGAPVCAGALILAACGGGSGGDPPASSGGGTGGSPTFGGDSARITNPYLPISRFDRCVLAGNDRGQRLRIVRTLEGRTQPFTFRGRRVNAAVVADRVTDVRAGQVIERTVDYFAQDEAGTVYYFGEDVNEYKNGKLTSHEGQWRLGRDTQTPGVLMPANPKPGDVFMSEDVRGVTHETDHVVSSGGTARIGGRLPRRDQGARGRGAASRGRVQDLLARNRGDHRGERRRPPGRLQLVAGAIRRAAIVPGRARATPGSVRTAAISASD